MTRIDTVRLGGRNGPEIGVQGLEAMGIEEFYGDLEQAPRATPSTRPWRTASP
ncbi:hypothetical protein SNARM312S_03419 [Streptomyces narbonensis]